MSKCRCCKAILEAFAEADICANCFLMGKDVVDPTETDEIDPKNDYIRGTNEND